MKHLFSSLLALCITVSAFAGKNVTLHDVMYGGYWPQTYAAIIVAGSAIFKAPRPKAAIANLRELADQNPYLA